MSLESMIVGLSTGDLLQTSLPDFVLAFAFFTSLVYATLGRRFEHQRPAVMMSAALGLALSAGLVWWERSSGLSIRDLGPIAVGFAVIVLAGVIYHAIRQVGGSWAGAGIALGASILVGTVLGVPWPVRPQILQTMMTVALTVGTLAFLVHHQGHAGRSAPDPQVRHDMSDLYEQFKIPQRLDKGLKHAWKESRSLEDRPEEAGDVMAQLKRMLPAEGWLTERMARLREKAYLIRKGHVAKLEETEKMVARLPASKRKKIAAALSARYQEMAGMDHRIERLDQAVAANEQQIRELTRQAEEYLAAHEYRKLPDVLKAASKLQHHNSRLFKVIDRTERKLVALAQQAAKESSEVSGG